MGVSKTERPSVGKMIKRTAMFVFALVLLVAMCLTARVAAEGTYIYNDVTSLATALGDAGAIGVTVGGGEITNAQFSTSEGASRALIVLSNAEPSLYANATLKFNDASVDLTTPYGEMTFLGLGGESAPFCGTLLRSVDSITWVPKVNVALFNAIDVTATLPADTRFDMGTGGTMSAPLFAEKVTNLTSAPPKAWSFNLEGQGNATVTTGGFIGTVGANTELTMGLSFAGIGAYHVNAGGNAGGVCNTLSAGSKLTVTAFSPSVIWNISGADAGTIVGSMGDNAILEINTFSPMGIVTVQGSSNAGGIVGNVGSGASVTVGTFSPASVSVTASTNAGGAVGFMGGGSNLTLTGSYAPTGTVNVTALGQAGGAVGFMGGSAALNLSVFSPQAMNITSTEASAGAVVGTAGNDTALTVGTFSPSGAVAVTGSVGAGSLVGSFVGDAAHGSTVNLTGGWSVPTGATLTVTGNQFAGGLFGQMTDGTVALGAGQTIAFDNKTTVKGKNVGGIYGKLVLSASYLAPASDYNTSNRINLENTASGETLGGVVGLLTLTDQNAVCTVGGTDAAHKMNVYTSITLPSGLNNSVGGVIGFVYSTAAASKNAAVTVQNTVANMKFTSNDSLYNGGIIGKLGDGNGVYALIQDCEVKTDKPTGRSYGFGGAVSYMSDKSVLKAENFKLDTTSKELSGAGVVSRINQDAVLCFSGILDLSNAKFGGNALGQVVGEQKNSLVYAMSGFVFNRGYANAGVNVNDIGNYGEVIRLGGYLSADLFTIDTDNKVVLKSGAMYGYASNEVTVANADQFAVLACSMQNNFFLASGISRTDQRENSALLGKTIKITADINLTETGVYSLMRDMWESDGINFGGTLMGVGSPAPTITIDTGAAWGNKHANGNNLDGRFTGMDRNGEKHSNLGLLRSVKGTVAIKNLKIDGTYTYYAGRGWGKGGVLVAYGDGNVTFEDIEVDVATKFYVAGGGDGAPIDIGCLIASGISKSNGTLTVKNVTIKNKIDVVRTAGAAKFGCIMGRLTSGGFNNITLEDVTFLADVEIVTGGSVQGGMAIGLIEGSGTLTVRNVVFGNETTKTKFMSDANSGGGLLGYDWTVDVVFDGTESAYGLHVKNAEMTANNVNFGALCYQAYGYWNVPAYGIKLEGLTVNKSRSGTTGLLINKAPATDKKALYLELSSPNSYYIGAGVSISVPSTSSERFDELVRQLYDDEKELVNGQSIISVATSDGGGVNAGEISNTYYNKTTNHGEVWYVNGNARYYYNLHLYRTKNEAGLSPAEKLLIWSVRQYTTSYIKDKCFTAYTGYPLNCAADTVFDLRGYSYFPVDAAGITVKKATVIFDNDSIDQKENLKGTSEIKTKMLTYRYSPHYMMHSGLFNDINGDLTVDELTLQGNVTYSRRNTQYSSSCDDNNGVLIGGAVASGADDSHKNTLNIKRVVLDGIYLNGYDDSNVYAPLLINKIGEYVTLNMETVYTKNDSTPKNKYEDTNANDTWHAASSLIGDIGWYNSGDDTGAKGITLSFSDIRLDARQTRNGRIDAYGTYRSIFKFATLINSFKYKENCSGIYNFTKEEDWNGSTHKQWVTYGYEISGSTKNPNEQLHYYDSTFYTNANAVPDELSENNFSSYLKYVYTTGTGAYEIDVNLTIYIFAQGCGTYGHPYIIARGGQLEGLAFFLLNNEPKNGVIVCIYNGSTENVHIGDDSEHKYYRYNSSTHTWDISDTMTSPAWTSATVATADILEHMRTAYYYIDEDITIGGTFGGLGTRENPFAGVIVGNAETTPTVSIRGYQAVMSDPKAISANGLVNAAKGCVIKKLVIAYESDGIVTVANETEVAANTVADYFGGVIGHVIGGDNIIDGVSVSLPNISVTLGSNSGHLCTVGGMVGVIRNGGVVFRGTNAVTGADERFGGSAYATLYCNPYVGRVLDGYAFSEGDTVNNNDKQYKIPTVSAGQITVNGSTITAVSPRDLYLLSALTSSGAMGSKDATKPAGYDIGAKYRGRASYANVKPATVAEAATDYAKAKKDNASSADGSYLFVYFGEMLAGDTTYNVNLGNNIVFDGASGFDGTAFRGLGSRYGTTLQRLTVGNTQNRTIALSMFSREYANDNFLSRGIGFINQLGISIPNAALTVDGSVEAQSYTAGGAKTVLDITPILSSGDAGRKAGVGGFAGYVQSASAMTVKGVTLGSGLTVSGSYCVGGLVGMKDGGGALTMQDCFANGVTVKSDMYAGGLIGLFVGTVNVKATASDSAHSDITVMPNDVNTVRDHATFGGFAGYAKAIGIGEDGKTVSIGNICVANQSSRENVFIGGLIGNADQTVDMKNVTMTGVIVNGAENRAQAGGVIGKISDAATAVTLDNVNVALGNDGYIYGKYAGGYIGFYDKAGSGNVIVKNGNVSGALIRGNTAVGGIVGYVEKYASVFKALNMSVNVSDIKLTAGVVRGHVGGVIGQLEQGGPITIDGVKIAETAPVNIIGGASATSEQSSAVGGIVGRAAPYAMTITNVVIGKNHPVVIVSGEDAGGIIGYVSSAGNTVGNAVVADGASVTVTAIGSLARSGGIIGQSDNTVTMSDIRIGANDAEVIVEGGFSGGAVGSISGGRATIRGFRSGDPENGEVRLIVGKRTDGASTYYSGSAGGIIGIIDSSAVAGTEIDEAVLYNTEVYAENVAGGAVGIGARTFRVKNSAVIEPTVRGSLAGGNWTSSAAFAGRLTEGTTADGYNILIKLKENSVVDSLGKEGLWVGGVDSAYCSVKLIGVSAIDAPTAMVDVNGNCTVSYIIYTDFDGEGMPIGANGVTTANKPENGTEVGSGNRFTLFGHGAAIKGADTPFPAYIFGQEGRRGYETLLTSSNMSTYRKQHAGSTEDFSVFMIIDTESEALTETILQYAGFITSGGARRYWEINNGCISVETYEFSGGAFIKKGESTVTYDAGTGKFSLNGNDNRDSDKEQFTLVTFTISNDSVSEYKLYIPIIITKPVEVKITVDISQGAVFKDSLVNKEMAIIGYGKRATARVNYKYYYDKWDTDDLDWSYAKDILFTKLSGVIPEDMMLPEGTYITLIDTQSNDFADSYVVSGGSISKLYGSSFTAWEPQDMASLLKAEPAADANDPYALWVVDDENVEITVGGVGYRKKTASDMGEPYVIFCEETYFIVFELPSNDGGQNFRSIEFLFDDQLKGGYANIVEVLQEGRTLKVYKDPVQTFTRITETLNGIPSSVVENGDNVIVLRLASVLALDQNVVTETTERYMQFVVGLKDYQTAMHGYRGAIKITPTFEIISGDSAPIIMHGNVINMNYSGQRQITVPVVDDEGEVINLAMKTEMGQKQVTVNATLIFEFSQQSAQSMFPTATLSTGTPNAYVSFDPTMIISDSENFSSGARQKVSNEGMMTKYYRGATMESLLELIADASQLGINPGATSEPENGNAIIDAVGSIDMTGYERELENISDITVEIRLYKKNDNGEYLQIVNAAMPQYLSSVKVNGIDGSADHIWTFQKGDGSYEGLLEDGVFAIPLRLEVKRKPLVTDDFMYSNYKVMMEVFFQSGNDITATTSDYFIYTLAKIAETFD